jgi:predicted permease
MEAILKLLPAVLGLAAGFLLRRLGLLSQRDGETVFKLVFYIFVPAVAFISLAMTDLRAEFAVYPVAAVAMIVAGYVGGRVVAAKTRLDPVRAAVVVSSCMVVNTAFQLPFVQLLYGAEGVARIAAFDIVNTVATFTLSYLAAARGNPTSPGAPVPVDRLMKNPAIYAIVAGLLVNLTGLTLPAAVTEPLAAAGAVAAVLIPVGIGLLFDPVGNGTGKAALMVAARLVTGLAVAMSLVLAIGLAGVDRTVLLLIGVAPIVFAAVAFASLENLDVRLATNALSLSLMVSLPASLLIIWLTT